MNDKRVDSCFSCGAVIPPGFAEASCPACLMELGVHGESSAGSTDDLSAAQARTSADVPFTGEPLATGIDPPVAPPRPRPKHHHGPARTDHKSGQLVSHYKLLDKLGEGGMGVVWSAEDSVLKRTVAIKFLPQDVAAHADRLARFEREARVLASLNHPHVSAIYGLEKDEADRFLVLEHVDGVTLDERIAKGLTQRDALKLAGQIALGLAAAHDKGILHRDLKPANVKVTSKGQAKVLDFGLAKALHPERATAGKAASASQMKTATMATLATAEHVVVGTAPYMSPEQSSGGQTVDKRTDIWAFGCVLYEMLSGKRAFAGETISSTIRAIHGHDPDWDKLPAETPRRLRRLLKRCLEKDPERRLHDISDARLEIDDALTGGEDDLIDVPQQRAPAWLLAAVASVAVLVGAGGGVGLRMAGFNFPWEEPPPPLSLNAAPVRFALEQPGATWMIPQVSPDGRYIAIAYRLEDAKAETRDTIAMHPWKLVLHSLETNSTVPVPGTEELWNSDGLLGDRPQFTFSPDSQWLAFTVRDRPPVRRTRLFKVPVDGSSEPVLLANWRWDEENSGHMVMELTGFGRSLAWLDDDPEDSDPGTIVGLVGKITWDDWWEQFLLRVAADGSTAHEMVPVSIPDGISAKLIDLMALPGAERLLARYLMLDRGGDREWEEGEPREGWLATIDPSTAEAGFIPMRWTNIWGSVQWSPTGHLVSWAPSANAYMATPFDPERLEFTGTPTPVPREISPPYIFSRWGFSISDRGHLVWPRLADEMGRPYLGRVNRDGSIDTILSADQLEEEYLQLDQGLGVSDTGNIVVFRVGRGERSEAWATRLDRPSPWRVTGNCWWNSNLALMVSHDGQLLACAPGVYHEKTDDENAAALRIVPTDGSDADGEIVTHAEAGCPDRTPFIPTSLLPDNRWLLGSCVGADTPWRLVSVDRNAGGDRDVVPLPALDENCRLPGISPDGRWLIYAKVHGSALEVFARGFDAGGTLGEEIRVTDGGVIWGGGWAGPDPDGEWRIVLRQEAAGPIVAVTLSDVDDPTASEPEVLIPDPPAVAGVRGNDCSKRPCGAGALGDGSIVTIVVPEPEDRLPAAVEVYLNWAREMESRLPRDL